MTADNRSAGGSPAAAGSRTPVLASLGRASPVAGTLAEIASAIGEWCGGGSPVQDPEIGQGLTPAVQEEDVS